MDTTITNNEEFTVSLSEIEYEGPLSVLLDMLKRSEKNIYEVSIIDIINQFEEYLLKRASLNLEEAGNFIVMASDFHLYKSRMLLPQDMNEETFNNKLKYEIIEQMLEFQKYKIMAEELDMLQNKVDDTIIDRKDSERVKLANTPKIDDGTSWQDIKLYDLIYAFAKVLFVPETDLAVLSGRGNFYIEDAINMINIKLTDSNAFPFTVLFKEGITRRELVTFFLAMLEMTREKYILLKQESRFQEIYIFKREDREEAIAKELSNENYNEESDNEKLTEKLNEDNK